MKSAVGIFLLHTCCSARPRPIQRYLISSPALWWDDGAIFEDEKRYVEMHEDLPAAVFLSIGMEEIVVGCGCSSAMFRPRSR